MKLDLEGRRAVITGSTRGIGIGIARRFIEEGAEVMLCGRTAESVERAHGELASSGQRRVLSFSGDLTDDTVVEKLSRAVAQAWGALDVLVANLGSGSGVYGLSADREEWLRLLRLNLISGAVTVRALVHLLRAGTSPSVVYIGSVAGTTVLRAPVPYSAAKAGLHHAAKMAAIELAESGIRVNTVIPGNILTPGGVWDRRQREDPAGVALALEQVPLRRFGSPDDVAAAVVFLASHQARFITGADLYVDGGQSVAAR